MARREVIEINCDRCNKKEVQNLNEIRANNDPELSLKFGNEEPIVFPDLCRRCRVSLKNYIDRVRMIKLEEEDKEKQVIGYPDASNGGRNKMK